MFNSRVDPNLQRTIELSLKNEEVDSKFIKIQREGSSIPDLRSIIVSSVCSEVTPSSDQLVVFLANDDMEVKVGLEVMSTLNMPSLIMLPNNKE